MLCRPPRKPKLPQLSCWSCLLARIHSPNQHHNNFVREICDVCLPPENKFFRSLTGMTSRCHSVMKRSCP